MKRALLILAVLLAPLVAAAQPQPVCRADRLIQANGRYLQTQTGHWYKLYPGQGWRTALWLPQDRLNICWIGANAYRITDLSMRNQSVQALDLN